VTVSTDFERSSEETEASVRIRELDGGAPHAGAPRLHRSSTRAIHAPTERDGASRAVRAGTIAVADLYRDLATGISAAELEAVRHAFLLPVVRVDEAPCELAACAEVAEAHGLLGAVVIDGLLVGEMHLAGHVSAHIYGPGDVLTSDHEPDGSLTTAQALHAPVPTSLAVLDERFVVAMRRWPRLAPQFFSQAMRQVDRAGEHRAICQLTRVEDRLLALFWFLADRWGRVRVDGVAIDLPLTHETIGRLIGARRPTVTLGLRKLSRQDLLRREPDGRWLLAPGSHHRINGAGLGNGWYPSPVGVAS
jgi:CRP/FNR family transcriptional regulator, cyclic AMP receptor protein